MENVINTLHLSGKVVGTPVVAVSYTHLTLPTNSLV